MLIETNNKKKQNCYNEHSSADMIYRLIKKPKYNIIIYILKSMEKLLILCLFVTCYRSTI
jgi:hypothetical protein